MNRFTNKFHRDLRHPEKKEKKMQIVKTTIDTENGLLGEGEFRCAVNARRKQVVIEAFGKFYLYSYVKDPDFFGKGISLDETVLFECDGNGNVTDWTDVANWIGYVSIEDVMNKMATDNIVSVR